MARECLEAIQEVFVHIGNLQGILIAEGSRQDVEMPDSWRAPAVAVPTDAGLRADFDLISEHLALEVTQIGNECIGEYLVQAPPSQNEQNAMGETNSFRSPFQRPVGQRGRHSYAPTAQQLWFELNMINDFVADWVNEVLTTIPYRHAVSV